MTQVAVSSPPRLLRRREVERMTSLSRSEIYRRLAAGEFPVAVRLGAHPQSKSVAWLESDIVAWIDARVAASRGGKRAA